LPFRRWTPPRSPLSLCLASPRPFLLRLFSSSLAEFIHMSLSPSPERTASHPDPILPAPCSSDRTDSKRLDIERVIPLSFPFLAQIGRLKNLCFPDSDVTFESIVFTFMTIQRFALLISVIRHPLFSFYGSSRYPLFLLLHERAAVSPSPPVFLTFAPPLWESASFPAIDITRSWAPTVPPSPYEDVYAPAPICPSPIFSALLFFGSGGAQERQSGCHRILCEVFLKALFPVSASTLTFSKISFFPD